MNFPTRKLWCMLAALLVLLPCALREPSWTMAQFSSAGGKPASKPSRPKLSNEQKLEIIRAIKEFKKPDSQKSREAAFDKIVAFGPAGVETISPIVDEMLAADFAQYTRALAGKVREAYIKRLEGLTDEQILQVEKMRRLWHDYATRGGSRHNFQKEFLKPAWEVAEFLLIKPDGIKDPALTASRAEVIAMLDYQTKCREALGIEPDPDPTKKKTSPTGIAYPPLDEPPTRLFCLEFLERTVALCALAPPGARKILLMNVESAKEIDVQETEFTMYTNTVRMLIGQVAWYVDPLVCAVTRDHSNDRKLGLASAHMSTVPGKHGFVDRLRRMGARFCGSEGAGGGRNGPAYAYGLSYGGGHTGPLYSSRRNVVGVGRRDGAYTSDYATDKSLLHPCAVSLHEMFMPPGIGRSDVRNPALRTVYTYLYNQQFAKAYEAGTKAKLKDDLDKMIMRFFLADVQAEMDWFFEAVAVIEPTGDIYELKRRVDWAIKAFGGIEAFDEKIKPLHEKLGGDKPEKTDKDLAKEFEAGKIYQAIHAKHADGTLDIGQTKKYLAEFMKRYPDSLYSKAAQACLDDYEKKKDEPKANLDLMTSFRAKGDGDALDKYSYFR